MAGWRSPELSGGWVELHCLGAGGFGTVMLFENKVKLMTVYMYIYNITIKGTE